MIEIMQLIKGTEQAYIFASVVKLQDIRQYGYEK